MNNRTIASHSRVLAAALLFATGAWAQPVPVDGPTVRPTLPTVGVPAVPPFDTTWKPARPALPSVEDGAPPERYIAPDIRGLYARLQAEEADPRGHRVPPKVQRLKPYQPYQNPVTRDEANAINRKQVVVKFAEGTGVRLRDGKLQMSTEASAQETRARLARTSGQVRQDLVAMTAAIAQARGTVGRAAEGVDESDLSRLRRAAERGSGREMPDPNLFYFVHLPDADTATAEKLLATLRSLRTLELAYFQPVPYPAADIPPITTVDVTASQGYFGRAPVGIDVNFARKFTGGRGDTIRIIDVEGGWRDVHEDLPPTFFRFGVNWQGDEDSSHGAAVLGEIAAVENGFGATGIAPNALIGWSSVTNLLPFGPRPIYFYSVGEALVTAAHGLDVGDIALIEQQFVPPTAIAIVCQPGSTGCVGCHDTLFVAVEEYAYEHAAISWLTGAGVIVVEAAGNGGLQVNPASTRDSGAIVVGAATPNRRPFCWSNFGPRVNVSAWGGSIGTLGYGGFSAPRAIVAVPALRANGTDADQWYTTSFGGTSGASPIVAGAAAIVQSTRIAVGQPRLSSIEMRDLLATTGTPQAAGSTPNVGPQPNLRAAIASYRPDAARFVQSLVPTTTPVAPSAPLTRTVTFANSGGISWIGDHTMAVARSAQSGAVVFAAPLFTLGSAMAPVDPGDAVAHVFNTTAPSSPGIYDLVFVVQDSVGRNLAQSPREQIVVAVPGAPLDNASINVDSFPGSIAGVSPVNPPSGYKSGTVTVTVTNTGTTTWQPAGYSLRVDVGMRIAIQTRNWPLPNAVAPGGTATLTFAVTCTGTGQGSFSAQMSGAQGRFGQQVARTILCQP